MVKETAPRRVQRIRLPGTRTKLFLLFSFSGLLAYGVAVQLLTLMQGAVDIPPLLLLPSFSRLLLVGFCAQLCLVILTFPERTAAGIRERLLLPGSAHSLAIARIVVFSVWLLVIDTPRLAMLAGLPEPLMHSGVSNRLMTLLPYDPGTVHLAARILQIAAAAAAGGLCFRLAAWTVALSGSYLLLLLQLYQAPYSFALLLVLTLVLACSAAANVYSVEGYFVRGHAENISVPHTRYGLPLVLLRLSAAFSAFMGVALCLWQSGLGWTLGGGVARELQAAWFLGCRTPPALRVDQVPVLFQFLGAFELIVGLLLPCAVFSKRLRGAVSAYWLMLQLCNLLLGRLPLPALALVNLVFVDWDWLRQRMPRLQFSLTAAALLRKRISSLRIPQAIARCWIILPLPCNIVFACVLGIAVAYAADAAHEILFLESFPRSRQWTEETVEIIGLAGYSADGTVERIDQDRARKNLSCPLFFSVHRSIAQEQDSRVLGLRLAALWDAIQEMQPPVAAYSTAQFYRDSYSIIPELGNFNPVDRRLLLDISLAPRQTRETDEK